jgi:hypothetical protein
LLFPSDAEGRMAEQKQRLPEPPVVLSAIGAE